jgi:Cu(I)/Ag(I) efflux system membrane fusion protein
MNLSARFLGAFAFGVAAAAILVAAKVAPISPRWIQTFSLPPADAAEDATVFYRDPMGDPKVSSLPMKDGMGMDFLPVRRSEVLAVLAKLPPRPAKPDEKPLFWRDPMGGAEISMTPRRDGKGMDFVAVGETDAIALLALLNAAPASPAAPPPKAAGTLKKRILYYRNPMGLPDTSPSPKKDSMGMDYRPVFEGDDEDAATINLSSGKIQRTGVRSEPAQRRAIVTKILAPGSIQLDERRIAIVATRSDAFIETVADVTTGDLVKKGQILMRLYSPEIAAASAQYLTNAGYEGARQRLQNLAVPPEAIAEIEHTRKVSVSTAWPAPRDGLVLERNAIDGMKAAPGQTLFKLADLSVVWALIDVAEHDYARIEVGLSVMIRARGLPGRTFAGHVNQIYPQINRETRTVRVRVELANPDLVLRPDMYVEAEITRGDGAKVMTAPDSAVIDTGKKQVVILDKGDGRFEARDVQIGRRGEGLVEIRRGVDDADKVVVAANFLIDAESNLKAALRGLAPAEESK